MLSRRTNRIFLSVFFFLSGFCFSSWASRIPTLKFNFQLNDAELGTLLLAMPLSSLAGLPVSGWLVSRYNSKVPLTYAFIGNAIALFFIGFSETLWQLVISISCFSFALRMLNISINTQALTLQKRYEKKINGSFHGLWSTGGIVGVGFSTFMVSLGINVTIHLAIVAVLSLSVTLYACRFLLDDDKATSGNKIELGKPDQQIFFLGLLVFLAAVCEGGMFDWSGIYFKEVIKAEVFTYGYLIFMTCMALSRFGSDYLIEKIGMPRTYLLSAVFIVAGILLSLVFPYFGTAMTGFSMVGLGTAAVIPMSYSLAGTSKKYSAGMAVSIIATYGIAGMLLGPPLIGYLSHAFGLRISFISFAVAGMLLIPIAHLYFKIQRRLTPAVNQPQSIHGQ